MSVHEANGVVRSTPTSVKTIQRKKSTDSRDNGGGGRTSAVSVINQLQSRPCLISHAIFIPPGRSELVTSTSLLSARAVSGITRATKMRQGTTRVTGKRERDKEDLRARREILFFTSAIGYENLTRARAGSRNTLSFRLFALTKRSCRRGRFTGGFDHD